MPETITRKTLTVTEAATFLGVSKHFAYQAVREGLIPSIRIGRRILIPTQALSYLTPCGFEANALIGAEPLPWPTRLPGTPCTTSDGPPGAPSVDMGHPLVFSC